MSPLGRRLVNGLLTLGAILGACCLVLVVLGPALGVRPLLFRSGSMAPTIDTGDLALARSVPANDLAVGDIVSVSTSGGARVTHRIVDVRRNGEAALLTLRGDANEASDAENYQVTEADRVVLVVPWVGHVIAAAESPIGLFVLGMAAAGLVALVVRGGSGTGDPDGGSSGPGHRGGRRRRARGTTRASAVGGAAMAVAVAVAGPASAAPTPWTDPVDVTGAVLTSTTVSAPTLSCGALGVLSVTFNWTAVAVAVAGPASAAPTPWTDPVDLSGADLTTTTVSAPTLSCGALGVLSVTFNWTAVAGATSYLLTAGGTTYPVAGTTKTIVAAITGGTATVVAVRNFGSTTWTSVASNTRTYTVAVVSLCS